MQQKLYLNTHSESFGNVLAGRIRCGPLTLKGRLNIASREKIANDPAPSVEIYGVDRVPESDRTSRPLDFFIFALSGSFSLGTILFGWVAITLGLGVWSALSSVVVGTAIGCLLILPLIVIGSKTATNNSTASGAHFGVRGRLIGSTIGLVLTFIVAATSVWTGGDAVVGGLNRLFDTPESDLIRSLAYAMIVLLVVLVAIYGFRLLLRFETMVAIVGIALVALTVAALVGNIDPGYSGGEYALGDFWTTWILSTVIIGITGPLSYATQTGDWSRYISPDRHAPKRLALVGASGIFLALVITQALGIFTATAFQDPFTDYVIGIVSESPIWFVVFLIPAGLIGATGTAGLALYSMGLDLDAILPRLTRVQATAVCGVATIAIIYLGTIVFDAAESIVSIYSILVATVTPWAAITGIGYLMTRGNYNLEALQVFNRGETGGQYWFWRGFNPRAIIAWACGATYGLLAVQEPYEGPFANVLSGIDTSFLGSGALATCVFLLLCFAWRVQDAPDEVALEEVSAS